MRRLILLPTVIVACSLVLLDAQQPASATQAPQPPAAGAPPPQQPTFRASTNLVRVDVTVKDRNGQLLTGLTRDDFTVSEDGAPQKIEAFKFVEANGQPTDDLSLPIRSFEHARTEAARDDVRVFVIFWDEYHIAELAPTLRGRAQLLDFVQTAFGPTDLVAIVDPLTPSDAIKFTRDRRELADTVMKLRGRLGVYVPPRSPMEEAQLYRMRDVEGLRSQVTRSALEATIGFLGTIKEGRKSLLLVTQNLGPLGPLSDQADWLRDFIRVANTNNTAVYTLDPRGLGVPPDVLFSMAAETGGETIRTNNPAKQLRQMVYDASAFYLLGYSSADNPADGKFHKIAVHVNRPGVDVVARRGYLAPTLAEMTRRSSAPMVTPEIANAFTPLVDHPDEHEGDIWIGTAPGPSGPEMTVTWMRREEDQTAGVEIRATAADGRVFFKGPLDGTVTFAVAPGPIDLRRTLLDTDGASLGSRDIKVDVPDFATVPLTVCPPAFFKARTGIELRAIENGTIAAPYAGREFERTDRVVVRVKVAGTRAPGAQLRGRLLARNGGALADLPLSARSGGEYETTLTMGAIARGDYLVELTASAGDLHARVLEPLRVR